MITNIYNYSMRYLLCLRDKAVKKFPLEKEVVTLGRDPACDVFIDENFVSQKHAKITCCRNHITVEDLNSRNHIYVELRRIKKNRIKLNQSFQIGHLDFFLKEGNPEELEVPPETWHVIHRISTLTSPPREKTKTCLNLFDKTLIRLLQLGCSLDHFEEILEWAETSLTTILKTGRLMLLREKENQIQVLSSFHLDGGNNFELNPVDLDKEIFDKRILNKKIGPDSYYYSFPLPLSIHRGTFLYTRKDGKPLENKVFQFLEEFATEVSFIYRLIEKNKSPDQDSSTDDSPPTIVCKSESMLNVLTKSKKIAKGDLSILIEGESGTGKELVARFIHHHSPRREKNFIGINCAAIPETLLEDELFGHEKGAFTGAVSSRIGKLELSSGGTLVLDEIGDMSLELQIRLLRVLQENEFCKVGGDKGIKVNLRIIALTNKDLQKLVKEKHFRKDLYYRIAKVRLHIPLLKERMDDIQPLINHFFRKFSYKSRIYPEGFSHRTIEALLHYPWPGNVREMESEIESLVNQSGNHDIIDFDLLKKEIKAYYLRLKDHTLKGHQLEEMEREKEKIEKLLMENRWNKSRVADILNISRTALYKKLKKLNIQ